jgi:hypothetical protein
MEPNGTLDDAPYTYILCDFSYVYISVFVVAFRNAPVVSD